MKKIKFVIIFLIIIAMVLILVLLGHRLLKNSNEEKVDLSGIQVPNTLQSIGYEDFFTVSNCIAQYLDVINKNNSSYYGRDENGKKIAVVTSTQVAENIMGLISDEYKKSLDINDSNVFRKITPLTEKNIVTLTKVNKLKEGNVNIYIAQGFATSMDNKFLGDIYFIVNIDRVNHTFSIEKLNNNESLDNISRDNIEEIEKNKFNTYTDYLVSEEDTINKHIVAYKRMMLAKPELAYEYLDDEYKKKRFDTIEKFTQYINQFKNEIETLSMKKFSVNTYEDYKEYIFNDVNGNYYRIRENNVMDYTVMLDLYTVDLPQFVENYYKLSDDKKVLYNLDKFIQMINAKDYESAYNVLDNSFKENNFKTLEEFKKYIQDNFYSNNTVDSNVSITKEGKYFICIANLKNSQYVLNEPIERGFIVALGEGTDFRIAINLD